MRSLTGQTLSTAGTSLGGAGRGIMLTNSPAIPTAQLYTGADFVDVYDKAPGSQHPITQPLRLVLGRVYRFKFEDLYAVGGSATPFDVTIEEDEHDKIEGAPEAVMDKGSDGWLPVTRTAAGTGVQRADIGNSGRREIMLMLDKNAGGACQLQSSATLGAPYSVALYPNSAIILKLAPGAQVWWVPNTNGDLLYVVERY